MGWKPGAAGAKPCLGGDGVLMIAEDGLDRGDGGREPAGLAAADRCDGLGGVAASLGPDADGVPLGVGRVLSEGLGGPFQPSPGPADQAGDHSGGRLPGQAGRLGGDRRLRRDSDQGVEELIIAGAGELLQERGASLACLVVQAADELFDAGGVLVGQQVAFALRRPVRTSVSRAAPALAPSRRSLPRSSLIGSGPGAGRTCAGQTVACGWQRGTDGHLRDPRRGEPQGRDAASGPLTGLLRNG